MEENQKAHVVDALTGFVVRVAKGNATNASEIAVLPLVAMVLFEITRG